MKLKYFSRKKSHKNPIALYFLGALVGSSVLGCSPSLFFGGGRDQGVLNPVSYRRFNPACAQINLSSSIITVRDFRNIIDCFNSNEQSSRGNIPAILQLVRSLNDRQLQPIVESLNRYILNDRRKLFEIEATYHSMERRRVGRQSLTDVTFTQFGNLLEHVDVVINSIAILKDGRDRRADGTLVPDPKLMVVFELLAERLTNSFVEENLDFGAKVSSSRTFESLRGHFVNQTLDDGSLRALAEGVHGYLTEHHTYECEGQRVPLSNELRQTILDPNQSFFVVLKKILGTDLPQTQSNQVQIQERIKNQVPRLASIFQATLQGSTETTLMSRLADAFASLNTEIKCLDQSKTIPNGAMHLFRELNEPRNFADPVKFILRDTRLNMMALAPLCELPQGFGQHYQTLTETVETGVMPDMAQLLSVLYKEEGQRWKGCSGRSEPGNEYPLFAHLFANFLGDNGTSPNGGQPTGGVKNIVPIFKLIHDRNAWIDLLLMLALPSDADQARIQDFARFLVEPKVRLDGESIADVVSRVAARTSRTHVFGFVRSVARFIEDDSRLVQPVLEALRSAYHVNTVHPYVDLLRETMSHATENGELYNTLFEISDHRLFRESLLLAAEMARDGSLRDLLGSVIQLFHRFAEEGRVEVRDAAEPALSGNLRHSLSWSPSHHPETAQAVKDKVLIPFGPNQTLDWYTNDCRNLDPSFSWMDTTNASYSEQMGHYWGCLKGRGDLGDLDVPENTIFFPNHPHLSFEKAFEFLKEQKTQRDNGVSNQSYLDLTIELARRFLNPNPTDRPLAVDELKALKRDSTGFLIDAWIRAYDEGPGGRFFNLVHTFPLLVNGVRPGEEVLKPLLDAAGALMVHVGHDDLGSETVRLRDSIRVLESRLGTLIEDPNFPKLLTDSESLLNQERLTQADPSPASSDPVDALFNAEFRQKIAAAVSNFERLDFPPNLPNRAERVRQRVQQLIDQVKTNHPKWSLVPGLSSRNAGKTPQGWTLQEIRDLLGPVLKKIADPKQSIEGRWILDAQLNFLKYFTLPEGQEPNSRLHYRVNHFLNWLYERSIDYRIILYYYPGEDLPKLKLVNSLDLFELVLLNVSRPNPDEPHTNMGLVFLEEIAEAWGDLPRDQWPIEIQTKFPLRGPKPKTLFEAVKDIVDRPVEAENLSVLTGFIGLPTTMPDWLREQVMADIEQKKHERGVHAPSWKERWLGSTVQKWLWLRYPQDAITDSRARLFNLWQVNSILLENAPGNQQKEFNKGGGMEVLRDLFFEIYYSTPLGKRSADLPPGRKPNLPGDNRLNLPEGNNLSMILRMVQMGTMSQIGRQLQYFKRPDLAHSSVEDSAKWSTLQDLFATLIHMSASREARDSLVTLLASDPHHRLIWKVIEEVFSVLEHGSPADIARMKQMSFYLLAGMNRMEPRNSGETSGIQPTLIDLVSKSIDTVLKRDTDFLIEEADLLKEALTSKKGAALAKVIYEDLGDAEKASRLNQFLKTALSNPSEHQEDSESYTAIHAMEVIKATYSNPQIKENFKLFTERFEALRETAEYKALNLDQAIRPILRFFQQRPQEGQALSDLERDLSQSMRLNLASLLKSNDLSQFLFLAGDPGDAPLDLPNSERFYQVLRTLSQAVGRGEEGAILDFLKNIVRPSLSETPHTRYTPPHANTGRAIAD